MTEQELNALERLAAIVRTLQARIEACESVIAAQAAQLRQVGQLLTVHQNILESTGKDTPQPEPPKAGLN